MEEKNCLVKTFYVAQIPTGDGSGSSLNHCASVASYNAGKGNFALMVGVTVVLIGKINSRINIQRGSILKPEGHLVKSI